ncbi:MAG: stage II sporulation protein P [Bacillota bacterium]
MNKRKVWLVLVSLGLLIGISYMMTSWFPGSPSRKPFPPGMEAEAGKYYTLSDSKGRIILQTGFPVALGDEFIAEDNIRYRISSLDGWNGIMERVTAKKSSREGLSLSIDKAQPVQAGVGPRPRVAIYCTHSDESYRPTEGKESKTGGGSIFKVGYALASSLVEDGITVDQSFAVHDPHDLSAYYRSRRTMLQLMKYAPTAVFDVHRDSAPASAYLTYITGVEAAKVMIVVGRQNPNMNANLAFAERIKEQADQLYPGLIRGIFIGRGSYNQDLFPRALLFEIGTSELPEQYAQNAANCLGDVIGTLL